MSQAKARIWPGLAHLFQGRSTADPQQDGAARHMTSQVMGHLVQSGYGCGSEPDEKEDQEGGGERLEGDQHRANPRLRQLRSAFMVCHVRRFVRARPKFVLGTSYVYTIASPEGGGERL